MPLSDVKIRPAEATAPIQKLSDGEGLQLWMPCERHAAMRMDIAAMLETTALSTRTGQQAALADLDA